MDNAYEKYEIDHIEIYTPMAKALAYWHTQALGFTITAASADPGNSGSGIVSYVLESGLIRLVLTSAYPTRKNSPDSEVAAFIARNYCGVKKLALRVSSANRSFAQSIGNGGIPIKYPATSQDDSGSIEEASIKLYDDNELVFISRNSYSGPFKPGYTSIPHKLQERPFFLKLDHIASEVRINESGYWTRYLTSTIGTKLAQSVPHGKDNTTGMVMNISQTHDKNLTMVISEPDTTTQCSKIQANIELFGPGIHHLAFSTNDITNTVKELEKRKVEFVPIPDSYYDLLRENKDFEALDIDDLQKNGIIVDKEGETCLFQKFIKPISDRPFFLYEIVQRVNGYAGFAVKNITALKKAEERVASHL